MERLESSDTGRVVLSAVIVVLLVSLVAYATPDSAPKRAVLRAGMPLLSATGLGQGWGMFAPEPRREQIQMTVQVREADGRLVNWDMPSRGDLFGASSDYRWRKWLEWGFMPDVDVPAATAAYAVAQQQAAGLHPVRVTVIRRLAPLGPPGSDAPVRWRVARTSYRVGKPK
jgi:hypothetical protein